VRISVVTVCYNSAATIRYALDSFHRQTHPDKEMVIVDGASTDDTLAVVGSYPTDNVVVISRPDSGLYDAMNTGLAAFSGDAVGFLNSDDRFKESQTLSHIAEALADADIAHGNLDFVADHATGKVVRRWRGGHFSKGAFARGWMPPHPAFYVRRRVVEAVGRFNLRYSIAADYDYMLRAMEIHAFRSVFVDRVLVEMRQGGRSTGSLKAYIMSNLESLRSRQTWLGSSWVDRAVVAKPLSKLHQFLPRSGAAR
jgi:glycosyltransferase involved in cell wall biosynthesis